MKQALFLDRESEDGEVRKGRILENTRCVVFLSTPHAGAAIANAATYLGPFVKSLGTFAATLSGFTLLSPFGLVARLGTGFLARRVRSSKLTSQLARGDAALLSLNYWYRRLPDIKTHAFYETELTYRCVHVVDPLSADPESLVASPGARKARITSRFANHQTLMIRCSSPSRIL